MHARTGGAVVLVVIGTTLMVAWAFSVNAVRSIEDGTAGDRLVERALASPQYAELVADEATRALRDATDDPRAQAALVLLDQQIRDAVVAVASSDVAVGLINEGGDRVRDRLLAEVADPAREPGPFVLRIDVAERVNARLADVPLIGGVVPAVSLPVFTVDVMSAQSFEDLRTIFAAMQSLATWGLWLGIAAVAAGIGLAPRWRATTERWRGPVRRRTRAPSPWRRGPASTRR